MKLMQSLLLMLVAATLGGRADAALSHRKANYAPKEWGYIYYLTTDRTSAVEEEQLTALANQSRFVIASSSRQQIIERCTPVSVAENLYVLDLRELKWRYSDFHKVLATYPYSKARLPLIIRADWLVVQLGDESTSNARPLLLYGNANLNHKQFLEFWQVSSVDPFGYIEGSSPVGVAEKRLIENRTSEKRGSYWGARDSAIIDRKTDPLENPDNGFAFDAREVFFLMPKVSITTYQRGNLLDCGLFDGNDKRVTLAPANVVDGGTNFRGVGQIQNFGACIVCHVDGIKKPTKYELQEALATGYRLYAKGKRKAEQIELFHLGDVVGAMESDTALFAAGVNLTNGLTLAENAKQFQEVFAMYDQDVTLVQAAHELGYTAGELKLALGHATNRYQDIGARVAVLAHNKPMRRTSFESEYLTIAKAIQYAKADGVIP